MKVLVIGANNSGKGTLVKLLKKKTGLDAICCSNILNEEGFDITTGQLLQDDNVNVTMRKYLMSLENGIMDGYPRTLKQDEFMREICVPDLIVVLNISEEEVLNRAVGRRICENCGDIYNLNGFRLPQKDGYCDKCGGDLIHREDDKEEAVKGRYYEYIEKTYPIVTKYKYENGKTLVWEFDASEGCEYISDVVAKYINYEIMTELDVDAIATLVE